MTSSDGSNIWSRWIGIYANRLMFLVLLLGFSSGLPLLLIYSTLSARLVEAGIDRTTIGLFLLVQLPYNLKFLWSPLIDSLPAPFHLGQRRGWGIFLQICLIAVIFIMGVLSPMEDRFLMVVAAVAISFFSASQDIVIDAWRIEILPESQQGAGAAVYTAGYRIAMLVAGAGALLIAQWSGWSIAYMTMASLMFVGIIAFFLAPEPLRTGRVEKSESTAAFSVRLLCWAEEWLVMPFRDFMARPVWFAILLFVISYKLGEAMAGSMSMPLYLSLNFTKSEIAGVSKLFGFFATLAGGFAGGYVVARFGTWRALFYCGILQSLGNLFYIMQADAGHNLAVLAICVTAENLSGGMAGVAMIAYLAGLCRVPFTATQYALLSSFALLGRNLMAAPGGKISEILGWQNFFLCTTLITLPSLLLLLWIRRRQNPPYPPLKNGGDSLQQISPL